MSTLKQVIDLLIQRMGRSADMRRGAARMTLTPSASKEQLPDQPAAAPAASAAAADAAPGAHAAAAAPGVPAPSAAAAPAATLGDFAPPNVTAAAAAPEPGSPSKEGSPSRASRRRKSAPTTSEAAALAEQYHSGHEGPQRSSTFSSSRTQQAPLRMRSSDLAGAPPSAPRAELDGSDVSSLATYHKEVRGLCARWLVLCASAVRCGCDVTCAATLQCTSCSVYSVKLLY